MSDVVEQLRAQAVELRELHPIENPWAAGHWCDGCDDSRSLADLIDGMLGERERLEQIPGRDFVTHMDNFVLPLLGFHVTAVLSGCTQTAREAQ